MQALRPLPSHTATAAEMCAEQLGISREEQDAHAIASVERARAAAQAGLLDWEVAPMEVPAKGGGVQLVKEVGPRRAGCPYWSRGGRAALGGDAAGAWPPRHRATDGAGGARPGLASCFLALFGCLPCL